MKQRSSNRRSAGVAGVKALIATASVAATIAGWALLPANDPQAIAGATSQTSQQPYTLTVPGGGSSLVPNSDQSAPSTSDSQLPQVQAPQGFSRSPITRTHSSR